MHGDGFGLLAGQAALFDRAVGGVARGVDGVDSDDPAVLVDRDEAVRGRWQALETRAVEGR